MAMDPAVEAVQYQSPVQAFSQTQNATPNTPSSAYNSMAATWQMIADIRAGADAIRHGKEKYLPKFEAEDQIDYARRCKSAPWRPEFNDALAALIAKPFTQEISIKGAEDAEMKAFIEDVDTRGNNLTMFAKDTLENGIAAGLHAIFVENTVNVGLRTVAEEKAAGVRPYFIHVKAIDLIAVYIARVSGKMAVVHARIRESVVDIDGFGEKRIHQVRVLTPGKWEVYRPNEKGDWLLFDEGVTSLPYVPLVLYFTGERHGDHMVKPPLKDLADLQIELYRALSREDEVLNFSGFPMLSGNGFARPKESIKVGPRAILYAPAGDVATSWSFVQPNAAVLALVSEKCKSIATDMARLGMQPIVAKAGLATATATSIDAAKAHSVLQSWVMGLSDALEQAFTMVGDYRGQNGSLVEVDISTDFSALPFVPAPLLTLQTARDARDISQRTYWEGLRRFDVLPPGFDMDAEAKALASETQDLVPEVSIDPLTGKPVPPAPNPPPAPAVRPQVN